MNSQHASPALTVRPDVRVKDAAGKVLSERELEMQAFIVACLTAVKNRTGRLPGRIEDQAPPTLPGGPVTIALAGPGRKLVGMPEEQ